MKNLPIILTILLSASTALASQCILTGTLAGATFAVGMDLDGDGNAARAGTLRARGGQFAYIDTVVDTLLIGPCPGGLEIRPSGHAVFVTGDGQHAVFATVDSSVHLCTGEPETVQLTITGGRGMYAGATGTGSVLLPDDFVLQFSATGYPQVVYTHGASYALRVVR